MKRSWRISSNRARLSRPLRFASQAILLVVLASAYQLLSNRVEAVVACPELALDGPTEKLEIVSSHQLQNTEIPIDLNVRQFFCVGDRASGFQLWRHQPGQGLLAEWSSALWATGVFSLEPGAQVLSGSPSSPELRSLSDSMGAISARISPACSVTERGTVLVNSAMDGALVAEYDRRGRKLKTWGSPLRESDLLDFGFEAAGEGWRVFNLGQILARSEGGFALAFSHLPLVHWYEADGKLSAIQLRGPVIEQILERFKRNQHSCDGGKYQRYGTSVPVIVRSAALAGGRLYLLIGASLFRLHDSDLVPVDWPLEGSSVRRLVSLGEKLGARTADGRLHFMRVDAAAAEEAGNQ